MRDLHFPARIRLAGAEVPLCRFFKCKIHLFILDKCFVLNLLLIGHVSVDER